MDSIPNVHGIKSAVIVVEADSVLLVRHLTPSTVQEWRVPLEGGVNSTESGFDCARREVFGGSGLSVELDDNVCVHEFVDSATPTYHRELFIIAKSYYGTITIPDLVPGDRDYER